MALILRLLAMLVPNLVGLHVATQMVAAAYRYHAALGRPVAHLGHVALYPPWAVGVWLWRLGPQHPDVFQAPVLVAGAGVLTGIALVGITWLVQGRQRQAPTTYGSAHWASAQDVRRSGLL